MNNETTHKQPHKIHHPMITWGIISGLSLNLIVGTTFIVRLESAITQNTSDIGHTKELHKQDNGHIKEKLEDIREDQQEIKRLIREAIKD